MRSSESGHPCFVPHLREKAFSVLPLSIILSGGFLQLSFVRLRKTASISSWLSFHHERVLFQVLFLHLLRWLHGIFCGLNCNLPKYMFKSLNPVPTNVTLLGNRDIAGVIKWRWEHIRLGWTLNPMTCVLLWRERFEDTEVDPFQDSH